MAGSSTPGPTVLERFTDALERRPEDTAILLVERSGEEPQRLSYADLHQLAHRAAGGLRELGVERGDRIVLALPTSRRTLGVYLAALWTGVIPVFTPAPGGRGAGGLSARRLLQLRQQVGAARILVPEGAARTLAEDLGAWCTAETRLLEAGRADPLPAPSAVSPDDVAHLQATSGTTGEPKVAVLRHRNIGANVAAIGTAIGQREGDRIVSWLPLYHDMGLICLSCALGWQRPLVLTDASNFIRHPINYWLRLVSDHAGTISPAPTSAYQVCARLARRRTFEGLDLSTWRVAFCGAEPVHRGVLESFQQAFEPVGLPPTTLLPVYGLAEATLAVTIPRTDPTPYIEEIDRRTLERDRRAAPVGAAGGDPATAATAVSMVSVGAVLEGHELRVVGGGGEALGERQVGEVEISGPSVIDGYWGEPSANGLKRPDGFLRTGDLGYLADGRLFVTGRVKEILVVRGRNVAASQIEALLSEVLDGGGNGVHSGVHNGVAAVGLWSPEVGTEEIHLLVESRVVPPPDSAAVEERIRASLQEAFGVGGVSVHWLGKGQIPKTTSGKIQRYRCKEWVKEWMRERSRRPGEGPEGSPAVTATARAGRRAS